VWYDLSGKKAVQVGAEFDLLAKISLRKARIAVLGLGHIGLPTALSFANAGFTVVGVDVDAKVESLRQGRCYVREPGLQDMLLACSRNGSFRVATDAHESVRSSDFASICVPTLVKNEVPDLGIFETAFTSVKAALHDNMAILVESTLPPGTMNVAASELRGVGLEIDDKVFLAYCPERLAPVRALEEIASNVRLVGGIGPNSSRIAASLFGTICGNVIVTDALSAELAKVAENTFRDLNIAYANLLALISERLGADVSEVVRLANTHPRVSIHRPGVGVGGPCLPKDPYLLIGRADKDLRQLIEASRELNLRMPRYAINSIERAFADRGGTVRGLKFCVLGVSYKADTEDITNSPARTVIQELLERGASVVTFDPYALETFGAKGADSWEVAMKGADCVMILTGHTDFKSLDPAKVREIVSPHCVVFDGPRVLDAAKIEEVGLTYLGTGYGRVRG
jgi:UDP-N-acetyl-D-mannosaminuronic acid dehydrogenase